MRDKVAICGNTQLINKCVNYVNFIHLHNNPEAEDFNKIYLVVECGESEIDDNFIDIKVEEDKKLIQQVFNVLF